MIKTGNNYKGYYLKIGNVEFNDPHPKRDSYKYAPALEQVGDSYVLASGYLNVKLIEHARKKVWLSFPPMTKASFNKYWDALHSDATGKGMRLLCEVYDDRTDSYVTDYFYHTDLMYTPIYLGGQVMYKYDDFQLIGY